MATALTAYTRKATLIVARYVVERIALTWHREQYRTRGDRHATPEEFRMIESDPCIAWDLSREHVESVFGAEYIRSDADSFYFATELNEESE